MNRSELPAASPLDLRIDAVARYAVAIGATVVLLVPAARGSSELLGWLPLWLLAMPLCAWWALHRFRLPGATAEPSARPAARRRNRPQARRRPRAASRPAQARVPASNDLVHAWRHPTPC